jgi:hypothetical protein
MKRKDLQLNKSAKAPILKELRDNLMGRWRFKKI